MRMTSPGLYLQLLTLRRFELPPTTIAGPLPVSKVSKFAIVSDKKSQNGKGGNNIHKLKRKRPSKDDLDDTPRAFVRLMAFKNGSKLLSGLDKGEPKNKIQKMEKFQGSFRKQHSLSHLKSELPKIMPGERMADFSARVNAALPVHGLINKGNGKDIEGVKQPQTRMEKKWQKMQREWRLAEARRKEEQQEIEDEATLKEDEFGASFRTANVYGRRGKAPKASIADNEDPWAVLTKSRVKRNEGLIGIHDVVQAPPVLRVPKEKFRTVNGARVNVLNVPGGGSLRRREELSMTRKHVVESYRNMMKSRNGNTA